MHTETEDEIQEATGEKKYTLEDVMTQLQLLTSAVTLLAETFTEMANSQNALVNKMEEKKTENTQNES